MHRPGQPGGERLAEVLQRGRRERQQPGAVVGPVEGDDPRLAGREQRRAQPDLDRVLAGDAELRGPEPLPQRSRHRRIREVAQRVHDRLCGPRRRDQRAPVPERRDAESAREIEVLSPVPIPDAAPLGPRPDHGEPLRPGSKRLNVSAAM
jgi:hypothetical protein